MDMRELMKLPEGWEWGAFGDSVICPDGLEIELDGTCPDGHVSPLREMRFI